MKVAIYTLGCKVNQYETQAMEQTLREKGHQVVEFSDEADAYVVNTCSVTAVSDQKSRQVIHRVQKQHPAAVVAVSSLSSMSVAVGPTSRLPCTVGVTSTPLPYLPGSWNTVCLTCPPAL